MKLKNKKGIWMGSNFQEWVLPHEGKGKVVQLEKHPLLKSMYDTEIQKEWPNTPIQAVGFIETIKKMMDGDQLLKNGYVNIFHVVLEDGRVVAVGVDWNGVEWRLNAYELDYDRRWDEGHCFVSLATGPLNPSPSESLDSLTPLTLEALGGILGKMEKLVEELKDLIKKP